MIAPGPDYEAADMSSWPAAFALAVCRLAPEEGSERTFRELVNRALLLAPDDLEYAERVAVLVADGTDEVVAERMAFDRAYRSSDRRSRLERLST